MIKSFPLELFDLLDGLIPPASWFQVFKKYNTFSVFFFFFFFFQKTGSGSASNIKVRFWEISQLIWSEISTN